MLRFKITPRASQILFSLGIIFLFFLFPSPSDSQGLQLEVTKQSNATEATFGQSITFTINLSVTGASSTTVNFTDTLPGGLDYTSIICPPGLGDEVFTATVPSGDTFDWVCSQNVVANGNYTFTATGEVITFSTGTITNVVTVSGDGDSGSSNDTANASVSLNPLAQPEPPIPSLNEWGMLFLSLLLAGAMVVVFRKQRTA